MKNRSPLTNLNDFSQFNSLPHERIIIAPSPIKSNEVSMEPVNSNQQFQKKEVDPSTKYSFLTCKGASKADQGKERTLAGKISVQNHYVLFSTSRFT